MSLAAGFPLSLAGLAVTVAAWGFFEGFFGVFFARKLNLALGHSGRGWLSPGVLGFALFNGLIHLVIGQGLEGFLGSFASGYAIAVISAVTQQPLGKRAGTNPHECCRETLSQEECPFAGERHFSSFIFHPGGAGHVSSPGTARICSNFHARRDQCGLESSEELSLPKFEECLQRLEKIVDELEKGDVSLDGGVGAFRRGHEAFRFLPQGTGRSRRQSRDPTKRNGKLQPEAFEPATQSGDATK